MKKESLALYPTFLIKNILITFYVEIFLEITFKIEPFLLMSNFIVQN